MFALEDYGMWITFAVVLVTLVVFVADRLPMDFVAICALMVLSVCGVLTSTETLAGFSSGVNATFVGLFIVGEGLVSTGIARMLGKKLGEMFGGSEIRFLMALMVGTAALSAVMSSTGAVAICIPVVQQVAGTLNKPVSLFLIPLSFASLLGGMATLIGTPPNLVVSQALKDAGQEPFGFFDFAPAGFAILATGIIYMVVIGRRLMPQSSRSASSTNVGSGVQSSMLDFEEVYDLQGKFQKLQINSDSLLANQTLQYSKLRTKHGINVLAIERHSSKKFRKSREETHAAHLSSVLQEGDILFCLAHSEADVTGKAKELGFTKLEMMVPVEVELEEVQVEVPKEEYSSPDLATKVDMSKIEDGATQLSPGTKLADPLEDAKFTHEVGLCEFLVMTDARICGKSLGELDFRKRHGVTVVGIKSAKESGRVSVLPTQSDFVCGGDVLLVAGPWKDVARLMHSKDLVPLGVPVEAEDYMTAPNSERAPIAAAVMSIMIVLMIVGVLPASLLSILGAIAMIVTGCVAEPYAAVKWDSVMMVAAMLPIGTALQKTGGIDVIASLFDGVEDPTVLLVCIFIITSLFSQVVSNTATAVILSPLAIAASEARGLSPRPFLMAISVAASTAFCTPVASPVNLLVYKPGNYKFTDFLKVGSMMAVLALALTVLIIPVVFPYRVD